MKNMTDPEENRGKPLAAQVVLVELSYTELVLIEAVSKTPHPSVAGDPYTRFSVRFISQEADQIIRDVEGWHRRNNLEDGS